MASGKVHHRASRMAARLATVTGGGAIFLLYLSGDIENIKLVFARFACFISGMIIGIWIDPDLDMIQITSSERRKLKAHPFWGRLWLAYWAPYGAYMSHRGLSHAPVIGTFTRVFYVVWPVFLLSYLLQVSIDLEVFELGLFVIAGWITQDFIHLTLDRYKFNWRI